MNLLEILNWRYATKKYSERKVSDKNVQEIVDAINLSAVSFGLQPYRLIVVENQEIKKELGEGSFNHSQIVDSSHLLVFAVLDNINQKTIDDFIQLLAKERNIPIEQLEHNKMALDKVLKRTEEQNYSWAKNQAYIGLGTGLIAAANLKIDATPMEGFDPAKFDTILGLRERGLKSVVLLSLGYRDIENDMFAEMKKVRLPKAEFAIDMS